MEQRNKNNIKFEIIKVGSKKMTLLEQKQIKKFLGNLFPTLLRSSKNFEYVLIERSNKVNGFYCKVFVKNKIAFFQLFIDFLSFIQNINPIVKVNKKNKGYVIKNYVVSEYY